MGHVAAAASARSVSAIRQDTVSGTHSGFAAEFKKAVDSVSAAQTHASTQARHFELGVPGVNLNDVMIDMQKASLGFQSIVQVRNKLVTAYQTIASMPL